MKIEKYGRNVSNDNPCFRIIFKFCNKPLQIQNISANPEEMKDKYSLQKCTKEMI